MSYKSAIQRLKISKATSVTVSGIDVISIPTAHTRAGMATISSTGVKVPHVMPIKKRFIP